MRDADCIGLLQECLPRLGHRWEGYRRVRRTVCRRIARRMREIGLDDVAAYRALLERSPAELARLDAMLPIPISRMWRDRAVFDALARDLVPELARAARERGAPALRAWSAGCASGEEAYSLAILWRLAVAPAVPGVDIEIIGTDVEPAMIERARRAVFTRSSVRELPAQWRAMALEPLDEGFRVRPEFRRGVAFRVQDLRAQMPADPFDLILCRNVVFTYFSQGLARRVGQAICARLVPGGLLVVGAHERPPQVDAGLVQVGTLPVWRRA